MSNNKFIKNWMLYTLLGVVILFLVAWITAPILAKKYINKNLANLDKYYGHVEDVDIAFFKGGITTKNLYLFVKNSETDVPIVHLEKNDITIELRSLFRGEIVCKIKFYSPTVNYVYEDLEDKEAETTVDWTEDLLDLNPIEVNTMEIINGNITYKEFNSNPNINLQFENMYAKVENLRNVKAKERTLPSPIFAESKIFKSGDFKLEGDINMLKRIPDMDLSISMNEIDITVLNDFTDHYGNIDFESGNMKAYLELAIADEYVKGYLKGLLTDAKYIDEDAPLSKKLWEGLAKVLTYIFENKETDTFATKAPFEGDLSKVDTNTWVAIANIIQNAFFEAIQKGVDDEIQYADTFFEENKKEMGEEGEDLEWWEIFKKIDRNLDDDAL